MTVGDRQPRSEKEAAMQQWERVVEEVDDGKPYKQDLEEADLHDWDDRADVEELIEHEVDEEDYLPLHDAFDDLQRAFSGWWS